VVVDVAGAAVGDGAAGAVVVDAVLVDVELVVVVLLVVLADVVVAGRVVVLLVADVGSIIGAATVVIAVDPTVSVDEHAASVTSAATAMARRANTPRAWRPVTRRRQSIRRGTARRSGWC